jgi:transcriptional regulator GlxA family with amidase domain
MKSLLDPVGNWAALAKAANYSVDGLAKRLGITVRRLEKFCLRRTGMTPHQRLTEMRQAKAWALVTEEKKRVKDVSDELGYSRACHFSRDFRRFYGISPSEARNSSGHRAQS